jgi:hypothetical protein
LKGKDIMSNYELDALTPLLPLGSTLKIDAHPAGDKAVISEIHCFDTIVDVRPENAGWDMSPDNINTLAVGSLGLHSEVAETLQIRSFFSSKRRLIGEAGFYPQPDFNGNRFAAAVDHYLRNGTLSVRETVTPEVEVPPYLMRAVAAFGDPVKLGRIARRSGLDRFKLANKLNDLGREVNAPNTNSLVLFGHAIGALATKKVEKRDR